MVTLENKTVVVVGGSSGIGFAVVKASLEQLASHVVIVSSSEAKVNDAVERINSAFAGKNIPGKVSGAAVDAKDTAAVKKFFGDTVGHIDHLVWTSGDPLVMGFPNIDIDKVKGAFDVRFWGAVVAAQNAKFNPGGSVILTTGTVVVRPRPSWTVAAGVAGAVDSVTRGLAVDLAPIRVNIICPGVVKTELWDGMAPEAREKLYENTAKALLVKHCGEPEELAEAYLFLMKCSYITGQRIEVDGGYRLT